MPAAPASAAAGTSETSRPAVISYVHPIIAALVLALLAYAASLAVRSRRDRRHAAELLRRHSRLAPWVYALVLVSWAGGLTMSWLTRPADEFAASGHFKIGTAFVGVLTMSVISSRWMDRPVVRSIHPWFGALALLLSAAQLFFGLQLLP